MQLAGKFSDGYDPGNDQFTEQFHSIVDNYHQLFLAFNQAKLRLGRVLVRVLEEHAGPLPEEQPEELGSSVN